MNPVLELHGLHKQFGLSHIIRGVNLRVLSGERHALIGPNGAGKSTLFNLISGLLSPSGGEILLHGKRIDGMAPDLIVRRGLARSFQITSVFGGMTVFENLRVAVLARRGMAASPWRLAALQRDVAAEVAERAEAVRLGPRLAMRAGDLAYAEQRALELSLTLAMEPQVVLLDEPTAGMSREEAEATIDLVQRNIAGRTLMVVEHDMDIVFRLCGRISVLVNGQVMASGSPADIAADRAVRSAYLGEPAGA